MKSFTADQIKKRNARYGFDYTTASGQKRLMYKSTGRDIDPDAKIDVHAPGDYGADPIGEPGPNMKFKMVPSGEIVSREEKERRLSRFHKKEHVKIEVEDFKMSRAKEIIKLVEYEVTGNIEKLKKEAMSAAKFRGHKMGPWEQEGPNQASSTCSVCGKGVTVNAAPAPNEIDIGGEAVAVGCKD